MAKINSYPNNADVYIGAEDVMHWHYGRTSGVYALGDNCIVKPVSGAMAVTVADGLGWLSDAEGKGIVWWNYIYKNSGSLLRLSIDAASATMNRIDRVVVRWSTADYAELPEIVILKGKEANNPTAPSLTNNGSTRMISLARIKIDAGTTAVTSSMITDERADDKVCGLVSESVGFSDLEAQIKAVAKKTAVDYIVEDGWKEIDGINWHYEKWNSGKAICSGKLWVSTTCSVAMGALFHSPAITPPKYPITFVGAPCVQMSFESDGHPALIWEWGYGTTTTPPKVYMVRHDNGAASGGLSIRAEYLWK